MNNIKYEGPVVLVIMDGVGLSKNTTGNAVAQAHAETLEKLLQDRPMLQLGASGAYVGLPDGQMGNSEVGHYAIGAGQVVKQALEMVNAAFDSGEIFAGKTWQDAVQNTLDHHSALHFIGILSDGNVHSDIHHLFQMIEKADAMNVPTIRVHILLDGRDVPAKAEPKYINMLEELLAQFNAKGRDYRIASGGGRAFVTADRYWSDPEMMKRGLSAHVFGAARPFRSALEALNTFRAEDPTVDDQYLPPFTIVDDNNQPVGKMNDHDTVIFYNFRADRAIQFSEMLTLPDADFPYFERGDLPEVYYAGMVEYDQERHIPEHTLVEPVTVKNVLAEFEVAHNLKRFVISESIKFGHVTFYFNGNKKGKFNDELEAYTEIQGKTGEVWQFPWMKSDLITDTLVEKIKSKQFQSCLVNFPNGDMVGHEANLESGIAAMEAVDIALKRILRAVDEAGGVALITADHGNLEELYYLDEQGNPKTENGAIVRKTSHTTNPVPFIFYDNTENAAKYQLKSGDFGLSNIAATIAMLHGLEPPETWRESLIELKN